MVSVQLRNALKSSDVTKDANLRRIGQLRDLQEVDIFDDGRITFEEFVAASMEHSVLQRKELILEATAPTCHGAC